MEPSALFSASIGRKASIFLSLALQIIALAGLPAASLAEGLPPQPLQMKDLSWIEIRGLVNCGTSTVIVPTGGIEQNGPQMVLGKHDYIVSFAAEKIARELGNTLVAPIVSFVPQGNYAPPSGNMLFPGTIGIEEKTFELLLDNIARSLKLAGFKQILFIGDHGQSQAAQAKIAAKLSAEWAKEDIKLSHIGSYYEDKPQYQWLEKKGWSVAKIGVHAGLIDTSELLAVHGSSVALSQVPGETDLALQGASGAPERATAELGKELLELRIGAAIGEIRKLRGR